MNRDADHPAVAAYIAAVAAELRLDRESGMQFLAEVRDHLCEGMAHATDALRLPADDAAAHAVAAMGAAVDLAGGVNSVHAGHGTADAMMAVALPVVGSLALRGLLLSGGTGAAASPWLIGIAITMLLVAPALRFARWRFAVASWSAFWAITLLLASTS